MKQSTFASRLAFARWLVYLRTGDLPGNVAIAAAAGRTGPWVTKWAASDTPPRDFEVHAPIARYLGVDERWLFRGEGEPPEPEQWEAWVRLASSRDAAAAVRLGEPTETRTGAPKSPRRKRAKREGDRNRRAG